MFTAGPPFWAQQFVGNLEIIESFEQGAAGDTLTVPSHLTNDMLIIAARAGTPATIPALPSGFTSILTSAGNLFIGGVRMAYIIDTTNAVTSIKSENASMVFGVVVRNASGVGASSLTAESIGTSVSTPALALANTLGQSFALAGVSMNQAGDFTDPAGHTRTWDSLAPTLGGGTIAQWWINPGDATYDSVTVAVPSSVAQAWAIELLSA